MFELSESVIIPAGASRVWQVLTNFAEYPRWHPFVRLEGQAAAGQEVRYAFRKYAAARPIVTDATIARCEAPTMLEFDIGVARLIQATEWYALEPAGAGVRLTHGFRISGALSFVVRPFLPKLDRVYVDRPLQRLALYLQPAKQGPMPPNRPKLRRTSPSRRR